MPCVLQITDKPDPGGGIRRVVEQHRRLLEAHGWTVRQLRLVHPGASEATDALCAPVPAGLGHGAARAAEMLLAAQEGADLVHLHLGFSALTPDFVAAAASQVPLVVSLHDLSPFEGLQLAETGTDARPRSVQRALARLRHGSRRRVLWQCLCHEAAVLHAPSQYLARLAEAAGAPPAKLRQLPHALDSVSITPSPADKVPPVIVYAGLISVDKGAGVLLDAFAQLATPDARLVMLGDGPALADLRRRAAPLGARVTFRGQVSAPEVARAIAGARLLAHPSLVPEGFGLVGIEAMQLGRPVAGFGLGGSGDWLLDGRTGLKAARPDTSALAEVLDRLLADADLAGQLGRAAAVHVAKTYSPDRIGKALDAMLRAALPSGGQLRRQG